MTVVDAAKILRQQGKKSVGIGSSNPFPYDKY